MIFDFPNIRFEDNEWIYLIIRYLEGWTEIPLNETNGYDLDELKFYDGLLGTLLKHTEKVLKYAPNFANEEFVNSWKYQGKIYRVIHGNCVLDDEESLPRFTLPAVDYHEMITHWTDNYTFEGLMYKLSSDCEYIILEADTQDRLAFDVNKFRKVYGCERVYTEKEREIIFPMYKKNIKEYRMTIEEFIAMKKQEQMLNG